MAFLKSQGEVSKMKFKSIILGFVFFIITVVQAQAADTIKVGILHSLSGTMAISETSDRKSTRLNSSHW